MSQTVIRGAQILNNTVQRQDLDTSTVGQAVVTKLVQGSGITLSSTGADAGTGDVTVTSPDVVSTDTGNIATLGSDNHILVSQSQIWSVRLRSFNAVQNSAFEVDQRAAGTSISILPSAGGWGIDRWNTFTAPGTITGRATAQQIAANVTIPGGSNFLITSKILRFTVTTAQASLGATDVLQLWHYVEGPLARELYNDVHSAQILVRSSVANLKFGFSIFDTPYVKVLPKLCSLGAANTWTLVTLPNLPSMVSSAGTFTLTPGAIGYSIGISLAGGSSSLMAPDTWQNAGATIGGVTGQSNFLATASATFDLAYIGHEPGAVVTTPQDCSFAQAYDDALRFYSKSLPYGTKPGTTSSIYAFRGWCPVATNPTMRINAVFPKRLAKTPPSVFVYNPANGTANACFVDGLGQLALSTITASDYEIYTMIGSGTVSTAGSVLFDYAADTGF